MRPMVSDEREKDVDPNAPSREDVQAMLDNLHAYSYRYKDESMPGALPGKQLGIMAQDMEKSPLGSQFVKESDEGHKVIDSRQMLSTLLASNAYLNERVNGLEGKKKKG